MNLRNQVSSLFKSWESRNRLNKDRSALMGMSDRELQDIGVSRLEINEVLRKGRK